MTYDPGSSGALSYLEAARELARAGCGDLANHGGARVSARRAAGWAAGSAR